MIRAIGLRIAAAIPVMLGVAIVSFFLIRLIPGDIVNAIMGTEFGDPELEQRFRQFYGINDPLWRQFTNWFGGLLRGDLGVSHRTGRPVLDEILLRFPPTFELAVTALIVSVAIAVPLGVLAATRRNGPLDTGVRVVSLIGLSLPNFWLGILLINLFAVRWRWFPSGGSSDFALSWDHLRFLVLPALAPAQPRRDHAAHDPRRCSRCSARTTCARQLETPSRGDPARTGCAALIQW